MKVIAKTHYDGFLVEMNSDEFYEISGRIEPNHIKIAVGTETKVSDIYKKRVALNKVMMNNGSYSSARRTLTQMLEALTPIEELIVTSNKLT